MRWRYNVTLASGKSATVPSRERIYDCLGYFRKRFGSTQVLGVTERFGDGDPVPSYLLPLSREEADSTMLDGFLDIFPEGESLLHNLAEAQNGRITADTK